MTPIPVDINNQWLELKLDKPLVVITSGASIEIRFSRQHHLFNKLEDFNEIYETEKKAFPEEIIEVELVDQN